MELRVIYRHLASVYLLAATYFDRDYILVCPVLHESRAAEVLEWNQDFQEYDRLQSKASR
jgi:hypothetical protein